MNLLLKIFVLFLAITGAATLAMNLFEIPFGTENYWNHHGVFFLIFITLFPRLTLLLSNVAFGGLFWWIGFIFAPRILVAVLATISYWSANPVLVIMSWLIALSGESGEKYVLRRRIRVVRAPGMSYESPRQSEPRDVTPNEEVIDTDFRRL